MKKVNNIPQEYQSNDLKDLKRAAIVNRDEELLRALKTESELSKGWTLYFAKADENIIRDEQGNEVPFKSLGIDPYDFALHFCCLKFAKAFQYPDGAGWPDGHLYQTLLGEQRQPKKVLVMELPADTIFPLKEGFGWDAWVATCNRYFDREGIVFKTYAQRTAYGLSPHRFIERTSPRMRMYQYKHDKGHTLITSTPPPDDRSYEII